MSIAPPLYTYIDQLISETWVKWSELFLNKSHDAHFTTARGFQDVVESVEDSANSNERTRAKELFEAGFLRGRLVRERVGGLPRTAVPEGWMTVQSDQNVHTILGYIAYALGKSIASNHRTEAIERSLSSLASIVIIQNTVKHNDKSITLLGCFRHILRSFNLPPAQNEHLWNRYVAAAMFCTLNTESSSTVLLNAIFANLPVTELILKKHENGAITIVTPGSLPELLETYSLSDIEHTKASLFWIGDFDVACPRGLYSVAYSYCTSFLEKVVAYEKSKLVSGNSSPFSKIETERNEQNCVLAVVSELLNNDPECKLEWAKIMKTLYQGVLDSLQYIGDEIHNNNSLNVFYAHGTDELPSNSHQLELTVPKVQCFCSPKVNDILKIKNKVFKINVVNEQGDDFVLILTSII